MKKIIEDERPITSICYEDPLGTTWNVGRMGVTKIKAYEENGQAAPVTWLAVYIGEKIIVRAPSHFVSVHY